MNIDEEKIQEVRTINIEIPCHNVKCIQHPRRFSIFDKDANKLFHKDILAKKTNPSENNLPLGLKKLQKLEQSRRLLS